MSNVHSIYHGAPGHAGVFLGKRRVIYIVLGMASGGYKLCTLLHMEDGGSTEHGHGRKRIGGRHAII